jgi:hypothetical protein
LNTWRGFSAPYGADSRRFFVPASMKHHTKSMMTVPPDVITDLAEMLYRCVPAGGGSTGSTQVAARAGSPVYGLRARNVC